MRQVTCLKLLVLISGRAIWSSVSLSSDSSRTQCHQHQIITNCPSGKRCLPGSVHPTGCFHQGPAEQKSEPTATYPVVIASHPHT